MELISYFTATIAIFGFLLMILSIILRNATLSEKIIKSTIFLMVIGTFMVFISFFFSILVQKIFPAIFLNSIILILSIFLIVIACINFSIAKSKKLKIISAIIIVLAILLFILSIWMLSIPTT